MASGAQHPHEKHSSILADLRNKIVSGEWASGKRIPNRPELAAEYQTTVVTIQKALQPLIDDGFVVARGRIGTFVCNELPHLSRYGIAFWRSPGQVGWTGLHDSFLKIAEELNRTGQRQAPVFLGINDKATPPEPHPIVRDAQSKKLVGVVFIGPPPKSLSELLDDPTLFMSGFMGDSPHPRVPVVATESTGFLGRALDHLAARGRRSVAIIAGVSGVLPRPDLGDFFAQALADRGMKSRPHWVIPLNPLTPPGARSVAHLLFGREAPARPDSLIITDDHLVESAALGLIAAGMKVPDDVEVVAHCNYPFQPPCPLPATWLGFDLRQALQACFELIDKQRRGQAVPRVTNTLAQFAHEVVEPPAFVPPPIKKPTRRRAPRKAREKPANSAPTNE